MGNPDITPMDIECYGCLVAQLACFVPLRQH